MMSSLRVILFFSALSRQSEVLGQCGVAVDALVKNLSLPYQFVLSFIFDEVEDEEFKNSEKNHSRGFWTIFLVWYSCSIYPQVYDTNNYYESKRNTI